MRRHLLLPKMRRLSSVFILNNPAQPLVVPPLFRRKWMNVCMLAAQLVFLRKPGMTFPLYRHGFHWTSE
ncbi:MAG: hypothetical protein LAP21_05145 [Acidobacteriia bacterium]|nr:hypothetical protein [Terriglobia bacterium]